MRVADPGLSMMTRAQHTAVSWNAEYPVGTAVRYWSLCPPSEGFPPEDTTTRSEAWTLGDGSVVVLVSGKAGGVHLSHVDVLRGDECEAVEDALARAER